ncbi:MAG TPA: hypothetical protein ENK61_10225 [Devosia sp.]|nr:hypothetical protein [Devosia sp.]
MTRQPDKAKKTAESSSCDRDEYKDLKEIESIEAWDEFLKQCRTGKLARLARAYRDKLVRTRDEKKGLEALREKQKNELAIKQRELEKRLLALKKQQQRVYQSNEGDLAIMEPDNRITRPPVGRCHVVRIKKWDPDGGLNIRTGPSVRNRKIGVIPYDGVGVVKHRCQTRGRSTWCNITYRGTRGWVSANFISCY